MRMPHFCAYALLFFTVCVVSPAQDTDGVSKLRVRPTLKRVCDGVIYEDLPARVFGARRSERGYDSNPKLRMYMIEMQRTG